MQHDPIAGGSGATHDPNARQGWRPALIVDHSKVGQSFGWLRHKFREAHRWWQTFSLAQQFGMAAASVILLGMSAIGSWVTDKIQEGVTNNSAVAATLYMDAFVGPFIQELAHNQEITPANRAKLDEIMAHKDIRDHIVSIKVWKRGGIVAYSNHAEIIGRKFSPTNNLKNAWTGVVSAEVDGHSHEDDLMEKGLGIPLVEIYAPIREAGSNRIIAVSEFYVRADALLAALQTARLQSWGMVGGTALFMIALLYGIVRRGSQTIESQQATLSFRASQNAELRSKIEKAYWRADKLNEQFLRRLGADLHDGPAQLIGFALMSLDDLPVDKTRLADASSPDTQETIRHALEDAIRDIRNLSRGLMLPELETMTLNETVSQIVRVHEERTSTSVSLELPADTIEAPTEVKICIYRFLQEALSNSYKHAKGRDPRVVISCTNGRLRVTVSDQGPGLRQDGAEPRSGATQLGLIGIRDRVETLAGIFRISSPPAGGTLVEIELNCNSQNRI